MILVTGAVGQIGSELVPKLREQHGNDKVIVGYRKTEPNEELKKGPCEKLEVRDEARLREVIDKYDIKVIYHMASLLSAVGEKNPDLAWDVNMNALKIMLDICKEKEIQLFWPSSIAVFGPTTPMNDTPQDTILTPATMYGVTKRAGELLCNYYFMKYNVDVRSLRYPGLISWKTLPGGGTTDYAVEIYHEALKNKSYKCFLKEDTKLPMMYMDDAIKATIDIMEANSEKIKIRESYNLSAISFTPKEIFEAIKEEIKDFTIEYEPDFRQDIADSWPNSVDDSKAREDWGWSHDFDLNKMTKVVLENLR